MLVQQFSCTSRLRTIVARTAAENMAEGLQRDTNDYVDVYTKDNVCSPKEKI
jgi:hypothetical protein